MKKIVLSGGLFLAMALFFTVGPLVSSASAASVARTNNALATISISCPGTLEEGSSGTWVEVVQMTLNYLHHYDQVGNAVLTVDGDFGPATANAVKAFQAGDSLSADGIVGPQTWSAMGFCTTSVPDRLDDGLARINFTSCPPTQSVGSSSIWVEAIQQRLDTMYADGLFRLPAALTIDGSFGTQTKKAVEAFQGYAGISVDGVVGSDAWASLDFC
jgi:peptidoglycan hydrolase-like protein with peptidoglycan-binding domain